MLALLLAACTAAPKRVPLSPQLERSWQQHQQQVQSYSQWSIVGRAALHSEGEAWTASLRWSQDRDAYSIQLSGPFGRGAVAIDGSDDGVTVHIAGQSPLTSDDAESLLYDNLGWSVPVASLRYWLRGLPAPGAVDQIELNEQGLLAHLQQQGWRLDYTRYSEDTATPLPRKLSLESPRMRLKLVLDRWQLG